MKLRVLIVEDDEALRVLAESLVEEGGYDVKTAGTVQEAQALIDAEEFHILFTDLNLHDETTGGINVAAHARSVRPSVPVIYTSGAGVTDGTRALFVDGAQFLPKPYTHDSLVEVLSSASPVI